MQLGATSAADATNYNILVISVMGFLVFINSVYFLYSFLVLDRVWVQQY